MKPARRHVLVTDAGRGSAVAFIRSLGRRGLDVTAADARRWSAGWRSRYTTDRLIYPDPAKDADGAVDAILAAAGRSRIDLVIPITDEIGLPLSAARQRFEGVATLALPEPDALAVAHDKARTLELARRVGVPAPPTVAIETADHAVAVVADLGWPVVIKPQTSREHRDGGTVDAFEVSYAADDATLRARVEALHGRTGVLLQRWQPGEGHGVELLTYRGRVLAAFQHRRIREVPVTGGASSLRESVALDPLLLDYATRLLAELAWTGLAMVEFRLTASGPELMEINGRVWGSLPLAVRSGMDFPARLADLLLDGPPAPSTPPATDYRVGVRARNLRLDLAWIAAVAAGLRRHRELPWPGRVRAAQAALSLLDPRIGDDLLARDDMGPGLAQFATIAGDVIRKGRRRDP
jgi:predicted ATP-grasp superfamily ATP-dependent carboligase